jgi:excisionase family DNA binding protein
MRSKIDSVKDSINSVPQLNLPVARGLGVEAGASYLGITVCLLRALITTGEIPFAWGGKRHIVDRVDLDRWLESRKQKNAVQA